MLPSFLVVQVLAAVTTRCCLQGKCQGRPHPETVDTSCRDTVGGPARRAGNLAWGVVVIQAWSHSMCSWHKATPGTPRHARATRVAGGSSGPAVPLPRAASIGGRLRVGGSCAGLSSRLIARVRQLGSFWLPCAVTAKYKLVVSTTLLLSLCCAGRRGGCDAACSCEKRLYVVPSRD